MRIPRDVSGKDLIKRLQIFGYAITRQAGSHIRLTSILKDKEEHHLTVPNHDHIRVGTLNAIISEVAIRQGISKDLVIKSLFE